MNNYNLVKCPNPSCDGTAEKDFIITDIKVNNPDAEVEDLSKSHHFDYSLDAYVLKCKKCNRFIAFVPTTNDNSNCFKRLNLEGKDLNDV